MITFELGVHGADGSDVVEVFDDGALVAVIYAGTGLRSERNVRAIRIISKFEQTIERDDTGMMPGATKVVFAR